RKYAQESCDEEAAGPRGYRWRVADRGADIRLNALHLHCVRARAAADGHRTLSVHAARDGGGVCHGCVLSPVANIGTDDGSPSATQRSCRVSRGRTPRTRPVVDAPSRYELGIRAIALSLSRTAGFLAPSPRLCPAWISCGFSRFAFPP